MAFDSKHTTDIQIALDGDNVAYGTAQFGDDYGEVQSARITRDCDLEELKKADGNLSVAIGKNFKFQLSLEVNVKASATLPGILERIGFPGANTQGRILNVVEGSTQGGTKTLSITATSWDVFRNREVAMVTDGFGAGQYVGPRPEEIDFVGWTFTNDRSAPGFGFALTAEYSYEGGPVITVTNHLNLVTYEGPFFLRSPLQQQTAYEDGYLFVNPDGDTACVYDISSSRLHFFASAGISPSADDEHVDYLGSILWLRSI